MSDSSNVKAGVFNHLSKRLEPPEDLVTFQGSAPVASAFGGCFVCWQTLKGLPKVISYFGPYSKLD